MEKYVKDKVSKKHYENLNKNRKKAKKIRKIDKKLIKNTQKQQISKDFIAWLDGIQEDEPVPLEVNYIYFVLDFSQNDIVLSYSGDENILPFFDLGFYAPLEGQYFDCNALRDISKDIFINKKSELKAEIFELLKNVVFANKNKFWFIKNKKVFYGVKFDKIVNKYTI